MLPAARRVGLTDTEIGVDPRLIGLRDVDMRILLTWDADQTDIDLHVIEPSGEQVYYSHNRSVIGGRVSREHEPFGSSAILGLRPAVDRRGGQKTRSFAFLPHIFDGFEGLCEFAHLIERLNHQVDGAQRL